MTRLITLVRVIQALIGTGPHMCLPHVIIVQRHVLLIMRTTVNVIHRYHALNLMLFPSTMLRCFAIQALTLVRVRHMPPVGAGPYACRDVLPPVLVA